MGGMLLVGKGHVHFFGLLGGSEPSRNYHQSKINVASTRRDGRRVQTHLGYVCSTESVDDKESGGMSKATSAAGCKEQSLCKDKEKRGVENKKNR